MCVLEFWEVEWRLGVCVQVHYQYYTTCVFRYKGGPKNQLNGKHSGVLA